MPNLKEFSERLGGVVTDFSQLNVRTFSGDLNTVIKNSGDDFKLEQLEEILKAGTTDAKLKLEALTIMKMDGDIDQFITSNISPNMKSIHDEAVATGRESRNSIIDFVKGFT